MGKESLQKNLIMAFSHFRFSTEAHPERYDEKLWGVWINAAAEALIILSSGCGGHGKTYWKSMQEHRFSIDRSHEYTHRLGCSLLWHWDVFLYDACSSAPQ